LSGFDALFIDDVLTSRHEERAAARRPHQTPAVRGEDADRMNRCSALKVTLLFLLVALVTAPLSAAVTILLSPLWGWFEAKTKIESLGHSGPAGWCYAIVYLWLLSLGCAAFAHRHRRAPRRLHPAQAFAKHR
jgi:hypothetical protein